MADQSPKSPTENPSQESVRLMESQSLFDQQVFIEIRKNIEDAFKEMRINLEGRGTFSPKIVNRLRNQDNVTKSEVAAKLMMRYVLPELPTLNSTERNYLTWLDEDSQSKVRTKMLEVFSNEFIRAQKGL